MDSNYATRDDMKALGESIIVRVFERMDSEMKHRQDLHVAEHAFREHQHSENKALIQSVLTEAQRTNGRVTRLETCVLTLKDEFTAMRKRWNDFRESVQDTLAKSAHVAHDVATGELSPVTRLDAKTAVAIYVLGMVTLMTLFKLLGRV